MTATRDAVTATGTEPAGAAPRRGRWWLVLPLVAVLLAIGAGALVLRDSGRQSSTSGVQSATVTSGGDALDAVEVTSDAPTARSLDELVGASDLVVEAAVVSSAEGRWFGDGDAAILSRLVTLQVRQVLVGSTSTASTILVEEEGWTADGTPLVVDGLAAAAEGDRGVWFLVDGGDPDVGAYVVVSAQGRYLLSDGGLVGASGGDPLVSVLSSMTAAELREAVVQAGGSSPDGA
ncbi:MAG: hypothetical protein GX643_02095 [Acidimicrobiales bacterium]|nr:hypothetical protein [Acidimicrobiales bacterium]